MVTEYPLTNKLPAGWDKFISFIKKAGAIATVGAVITGGTVGGLYIRQQFSTPGVNPPASAGNANIWINASGVAGASPSRCSPACAYNSTHAYGTFQAAYNASSSGGDLIIAKSGTYASQTISATGSGHSQAGPATTFKCETVHTCSFAFSGANNFAFDLSLAPSFVTFDGFDAQGRIEMHSNGQHTAANPTNITFTNGHVWGWNNVHAGFFITEINNLTISNFDVGPGCCGNPDGGDGIEIGQTTGAGSTYTPTNIVLNNVYIHNFVDHCSIASAVMQTLYGSCTGTAGWPTCATCDHIDGIQSFGGLHGFTMTNSRIEGIGTNGTFSTASGQGLFIEAQNGGYNSNLLLQNDFFGDSSQDSVSIQGPCSTDCPAWRGFMHVYYNTFQASLDFKDSGTNGVFDSGLDFKVVGNIINGGINGASGTNSCSMAAYPSGTITPTYSHNLMGGTVCNGTDIAGTATFVNSSSDTLNLHLSGAQSAINGGEATFCPATDIDGQTRPINSICDIGADEAG